MPNDQDLFALPELRSGSRHPLVSDIKALLRSQGHWQGSNSEVFGTELKATVQYFQSTHLGPDGKYLTGDGIVGPRTWWALYNPSGAEQRSGLVLDDFDRRYGMLSEARQKYLRAAFAEHNKGVHEIPDGSNGGDGVTKYIVGIGRVPWCALFQSWLHFESQGHWPEGGRQAHVQSWWNQSVMDNKVYYKGERIPVPGDLAVWKFSGGTGHISTVVASVAEAFNTIGGNEGNRVKLGKRVVAEEPRLAGFIRLFDKVTEPFPHELFTGSGGIISPEGTR